MRKPISLSLAFWPGWARQNAAVSAVRAAPDGARVPSSVAPAPAGSATHHATGDRGGNALLHGLKVTDDPDRARRS